MRAIAIVFAYLVCACAPDDPANDQPIDADGRLPGFLFDPFEPPIARSLVHRDAYARVLERFGESDMRAVEGDASTRDPTVTAELMTLRYLGLTIILSGSSASSSWDIIGIELRSDDYRLKHGLRIGSTRAAIAAALGIEELSGRAMNVASEYTDFRTDYPGREGERVGVHTYDELSISFDDAGRATEMIWKYYGD